MTANSAKHGIASITSECAPDAWLTRGRFAAILALLIFAAYWQVVLGWQTFYYRDFGFFGYPLAHYHRESFWRGEIPLWNPLNNCGLPFLAQWNTLVLYPGSLFYLLFPPSWSLAVFCLLHQFLAGMGMYSLACYWTRNRLAASVAGLTFAFNGLTLNCLMWPNNIAALAWMPWVVLSLQRACKEGGRKTASAAVIGSMQMLAGSPEVIALTWLAAATLAASESLQEWRFAGRICRRIFLIAALVAGISAAQLLPFLDLLGNAQRDAGYGDSAWAMPGWGWANFLVPLFHCFQGFHGVYWQQEQYWTSSYYPGAAIVMLSLTAALLVRRTEPRVLTLLTILCLILALGDDGALYGWLRRAVPQFGFMRFPIKFVVLVMFTLPLLAAYALSRLFDSTRTTTRRFWTVTTVVWVLLVAAIMAIIWHARQNPERNEDWTVTCKNGLGRALFLTLIFGTLSILRVLIRAQLRILAVLVLFLFLTLDVLNHAPQQNPGVSRKVFDPGLVRLSPQPRHGDGRAMVSPANNLKLYHFATTNAFNDYICDRLTLFANCNLLDAIPKIDGFYSLYLREYDALRGLLYNSTNTPPEPLCDFLGVTHISDPEIFLEWRRRPYYMPPVTSGQKPVFEGEAIALQAITNTDFNPRLTVYLPLEARSFVNATNGGKAEIVGTIFTPHREEILIEAREDALLVLSQNYYHPWRAFVDDQPTRIWRANYAFQAVELPRGRHRVVLLYSDINFLFGLVLSVATATGCLMRHLRGQRRLHAKYTSAP